MKTCPICGRITGNKLSYSPNRSVVVVNECPVCGYVSNQVDRSGLNYSDVIDRYKFNREVKIDK